MKKFYSALAISSFFSLQALGFQVEATLSPSPAQMGKQMLLLNIKNEKGRPAEKATVAAKAVMPATQHHPMEMVSNGKIENLGNGKYQARFNITMAGTWLLNVDVGTEKEKKTFVYEISTGKSELKKVKP